MPIFMKYEGVDGESTHEGHRDWIDVLSYSWGVERAASTAGGGGGGAGKVNVHDISFARHTGKASPTLMLACCTGRHFREVILEFTRNSPEGPSQAYLKYKLENCKITSYSIGGDGGSAAPTESLSLNFEKITYSQVTGDGIEEVFWDKRSNSGGGGQ